LIGFSALADLLWSNCLEQASGLESVPVHRMCICKRWCRNRSCVFSCVWFGGV